jgi:glutamyl-tRNA reductase
MEVVLVGTSHHHAPVEVRERVALDAKDAAGVTEELAHHGAEAVCLSTCNRTELYIAHPQPDEAERLAQQALVALAGDEIEAVLYRLRGDAAALHLFRVAAGLDSLVPGEGEILGQVRDAYAGGAAGPLLGRLFRHALHAGKRVRTDTAIGESPSSVSAAAAALAAQVFGELRGRRVLVIGAGSVGEMTARTLAARGADVRVANRSIDRGVDIVPLDELDAELVGADVVVSSTSAPGYVVQRAQVATALRARRGRPLFLIDLAVPRDLDPAIHELEGCYLYDIDDLEAVVAETLATRRREASQAEAIVAEEAERFAQWRSSLDVVPAVADLRARVEEIRAREVDRAARGLSDDERRAVESATARILDKLLHLPTVRIKEAGAGSEGLVYAAAVRHLFGLDREKER